MAETSVEKFKLCYGTGLIICGQSNSGKSTLVLNMIDYLEHLISPQPKNIYYIYNTWNKSFEAYKNRVIFSTSLPELDEIEPNSIVILDDVYADLEVNPNSSLQKKIIDLFLIKNHHSNLLTILITHALYSTNKYLRLVTLNSAGVFLYRSRKSPTAIKRYAQETISKRDIEYFMQLYNKLQNYEYVFLDMNPKLEQRFLLRKNVLPFQRETVYLPSNV